MPPKDTIIDAAPMQSFDWHGIQSAAFQPGLYIVATPIGNLRDITLRALDILQAADIILAEDTRQTQKLLNAYDIKSRLTAYHDHNAAKQLPFVITALNDGKIVAQVSDAGTPLISDPGFRLVREAVKHGHTVTPLPGASALLAALTSAALPTDKFMFAGFLPSKTTARRKTLGSFTAVPATLVFFESPARTSASLKDMIDVLGDRPAALARELTKKYEETRRGLLSELIQSIKEAPPRGEIVILVGPPLESTCWSETEVDAALKDLIAEMGMKRASSHLADLSGWAKRDVYQRALATTTENK